MLDLVEKYQEAVSNLISLNHQFRERMKIYYESMSPVIFALEFSTVKVGTGRRTGKTHYIVNHATENDLIIVPCSSIFFEYKKSQGHVVSPLQINEKFLDSSQKIEFVYIEHNMEIGNLNEIYRKIHEVNPLTFETTFVLLD